MSKKAKTLKERTLNGEHTEGRQNTKWQAIAYACAHKWMPVSMVFEIQLLDESGRVRVRQPDIVNGRCYLVCLKCLGHTYVETGWVGYYLGSPDDIEAGRRSESLEADDE